MKLKPLVIISLFVLASFRIYSQPVEYKISYIDSLRSYIQANEDNRSIYETIFTDGLVTKKKFGLFRLRKGSGGFAEQYTIKDSILVSLWIGKRIFLNRQQTISNNLMKYYIFENENLSYYKEEKFYEEKDVVDSLLYEITYYIDNDKILQFDSKGSFEKESSEYLIQILKNANKKIEYKNRLIEW